MGFTRYWTQHRAISRLEWSRLTQAFEGICRTVGVPVAGPDGEGAPVVTWDELAFNGAGADAFESFALEREASGTPGFCKTEGIVSGQRRYDAVVAAVLVVASRLAPGALDFDADGGPECWTDAEAVADGLGITKPRRMARIASVMPKARQLAVRYTGSGIFEVGSASEPGKVYTVALGYRMAIEEWECDCQWGLHNGAGCCHARAVELWIERETVSLAAAEEALARAA